MRDPHASAVQVVTWFLIVASILGVAARGLTKAVLVRSIGLDDYLITASLLFAVGQSVAISIDAGHGYNRTSNLPISSQEISSLKSQYSASLLYVASLGFAKASVCTLVYTLTPVQSYRQVTLVLAFFILLWTVIGEFGSAFLCHVPRPWDYVEGRCSDETIRRTWWNYFESTNIATDVALICWPLVAVWQIRISPSKKASVSCFFALRSTVIAAAICKLAFWNNTPNMQKSGHDPWTVILCTQAIECFSIISAAFLYLKPFLDSVESGFIRSDDVRRRGTDDYYGHNTGGSSGGKSAFSFKKHSRRGSQSIGLVGVTHPHHVTTITANDPPDLDTESQHSRSHIIKETRTFTVEGSTTSP